MKKETIRAGNLVIDFLLEGADTNGSASVFEFTVPPGARVPAPHYHESFDETLYGLEGSMTMTVDGKATELRPGDTLFIPRGVPHGFDNLKDDTAKALAVITPALLDPAYFREIAAVLNAGGPPDVVKLKAIMASHGLVPVMPK